MCILLAWLAFFVACSRALTGSLGFIRSAYVSRLAFASLKPNVGMYWYFFTQVFDQYSVMFATFMQAHSIFYAIPCAIKFNKDPIFMVLVLLMVYAILQPYPTVVDVAIYTAFLPFHKELLKGNPRRSHPSYPA